MIQQKIYSPDQGTQKKHETELERRREQGTRSGGVAEYRWRPVLRQELKGKEEEDI